MTLLRTRFALFALCATVLLFYACRKEEIPPLSLGVLDTYQGTRLQPVYVTCGLDRGSFEWRLTHFVDAAGEEEEKDELVSTQQTFIAILDKVGEYTYDFTYEENGEVIKKTFRIQIADEIISYSPYIADVIDYVPAPGRFVNSYLGYASTPPNTYEEVLARCKTIICGSKINKAISLGAFGGYVVFAFDHTVVNVPDVPDFKVFSHVNVTNPNADPALQRVVSNSSPGIVWVAFDANNNGRPDETEWYELYRPTVNESLEALPKRTTKYTITYTQNETPASYSGARLDSAVARDYKIPEHILWEARAELGDSEENTLVKEQSSGYIPKLKFDVYDPNSSQQFQNKEYWPLWRKEQSSMSFTGTLLPDNGEEEWSKINDGTGEKLQVTSQRWVVAGAYADNHPNTTFDISWAVDKDGKRVHLPGIQFVKVQTGVNLQLGHNGSSCTEIQGAVDLHLKEH